MFEGIARTFAFLFFSPLPTTTPPPPNPSCEAKSEYLGQLTRSYSHLIYYSPIPTNLENPESILKSLPWR